MPRRRRKPREPEELIACLRHAAELALRLGSDLSLPGKARYRLLGLAWAIWGMLGE